MRVLSVGNAYPPHHLGGYEIVQQGVDRALRAAGHRVRVLTTDLRLPQVSEADPPDGAVFRELGWYWRDHAWRRLGPCARLALERANAERFDGHLATFAPDVIAWWAVGGLSLGLVERARRAGLPAVLFVHDNWPAYGRVHDLWTAAFAPGSPWAPLARTVERATGLPTRPDLARAGRWLFNSHALRAQTTDAPPDWGVLPPGIAASLLAEPPAPAADRWAWRLLYLGRVVPQKGVETAVRALAELPGEAHLEIVGEGDGGYRERLTAVAAELGVAAQVTVAPGRPREAVPALLRAADAVVFPVEWTEPWGLVPLEAMAVGRPVVATGRGGSGDYLRDGENALLFPAGDAGGLARAVRRLAADAALRERLRAGGRATAEAHSETAFNAAAVAELERAYSARARST